MDAPAAQPWFLRKRDDGNIFGPVTFDQLAHWASLAQIAPHDSISTDQLNWIKAPMLPELGMDWIAEVTSERLYGPTTLGAIAEFLRIGDIDGETVVINTCDGTRTYLRDIVHLLPTPPAIDGEMLNAEGGDSVSGPVAAGMSIAVQERIRDLEQALREERRAVVEVEQHYRELERKYNELVEAAAASTC